jgi:hypothetical protein
MILAQHKIIPMGSHGSSAVGAQGSGNSEGAAGSAGRLLTSRHRSPAGGRAGGTLAGVNGGAMFGGDVPLASMEHALGRTLAIVRVYQSLGHKFQNPMVDGLMASGSTLLVSLDTYPGKASYASIAAGQYDQTIRAWLASVEQSAVRYRLPAIYVTFEHEANDAGHHAGLGTPAQFAQAWDHIHQLAVSAHLDWNQGGRIHWVMILTHGGYINGSAAQYWPGTGEVDIVGVDGYNTGGCRTARAAHRRFSTGVTPPVTPASLFNDAVRFAASHGGLPVFVAEWGSVAYTNPNVRVNFIQQMQSYVQNTPEIAATLYWDSQVPPCNYIINNSPASLSALTGMAQAPYMQGRPA